MKTLAKIVLFAFIVYVIIAFIILAVNAYQKQEAEKFPAFNTQVEDSTLPGSIVGFYSRRRIHTARHR